MTFTGDGTKTHLFFNGTNIQKNPRAFYCRSLVTSKLGFSTPHEWTPRDHRESPLNWPGTNDTWFPFRNSNSIFFQLTCTGWRWRTSSCTWMLMPARACRPWLTGRRGGPASRGWARAAAQGRPGWTPPCSAGPMRGNSKIEMCNSNIFLVFFLENLRVWNFLTWPGAI